MSQLHASLGALARISGFAYRGRDTCFLLIFQLTLFFKDPVHGAHRTEIALLIEKGRVDFPGCLVDEAIRMKDIEHVIPLLEGEGQRGETA
jgi:hypothetical protein